MEKINQSQQLSQQQNLLLSLSMQQAFTMLQMPALELGEWVELEIEKNPALEIDYTSEKEETSISPGLSTQKKLYLETLLSYPPNLEEHLMAQARLTFTSNHELRLAEKILDTLDPTTGFLSKPLCEWAQQEELSELERILSIIQTFDPIGIGGKNTQESLLIQLRFLKKQGTLAYQIILYEYEALLLSHYQEISSSLQITQKQLHEILARDIVPLSPHPTGRFTATASPPLIPDLMVDYHEGKWNIDVHSPYPHFQFSSHYPKWIHNSSSYAEKRKIQKYHTQGRWLMRMLQMRKNTLLRIGIYLTEKQGAYLKGEEGVLFPLRVEDMAEELGIHPSTAARALKNKYIACSKGIFPLKVFFPRSQACANGQAISSDVVKNMVLGWITNEKTPLSDRELAGKLKERGISCARRTVAKYRKLFHLPAASQRRFSSKDLFRN